MYKRLFYVWMVITVLSLLAGCAQRGAEERLEKVAQLYQKRDFLGARLEAKELVQKFPDSKEALTARFVLAQVYMQDRQPDEALAELEQILARTTQKETVGIQALAMTLDILKRNQRFDEAYKLIDKYQKEYADDAVTSLQLTVARADTMADAGETTRAREVLVSLMNQSTSPMERRQFRSLIGNTFMREKNPDGAAEFFAAMYDEAPSDDDKRDIALRAAWYYAVARNYEKVRMWTERTTELFNTAIKEELDATERISLALTLGHLYGQVGNLRGAEQIMRTIFDSPAITMEELPQLINELTMVLLRQGKADDAIAFLREAAKRYPQSPLAQDVARLETFKAQGKLDTIDTSPLVMRWAADTTLTLEAVHLLAKAELLTTGSIAEKTPKTEIAESEIAPADTPPVGATDPRGEESTKSESQ